MVCRIRSTILRALQDLLTTLTLGNIEDVQISENNLQVLLFNLCEHTKTYRFTFHLTFIFPTLSSPSKIFNQ